MDLSGYAKCKFFGSFAFSKISFCIFKYQKNVKNDVLFSMFLFFVVVVHFSFFVWITMTAKQATLRSNLYVYFSRS